MLLQPSSTCVQVVQVDWLAYAYMSLCALSAGGAAGRGGQEPLSEARRLHTVRGGLRQILDALEEGHGQGGVVHAMVKKSVRYRKGPTAAGAAAATAPSSLPAQQSSTCSSSSIPLVILPTPSHFL